MPPWASVTNLLRLFVLIPSPHDSVQSDQDCQFAHIQSTGRSWHKWIDIYCNNIWHEFRDEEFMSIQKLNFISYTNWCYFKHGVQSNLGIPAFYRAVMLSGFLSMFHHEPLWPIWFGFLFWFQFHMTRYSQTRVSKIPMCNWLYYTVKIIRNLLYQLKEWYHKEAS